MQQGRGGMGSTKHGKSGRFTRSPRYKFMQTLEDNRIRDKRPRRRKRMYGSVKEAMKSEKPI